MAATFHLLSCILAMAQPVDGNAPPVPANARMGDRAIGPRLGKAQEFVYRGSYAEERGGGGVQFSRAYRVETRVFVLDTPPPGADVAILTILKPKDVRGTTLPNGVSGDTPVSSVRMEFARVDLQGRLTPEPGVSLAVPLDGPATVECGAFVKVPSGRAAADGNWETGELGRPPCAWRTAGADTVNGASCIKLIGTQQSEDWDKPRADRLAWKRTDTVWLAPRVGVAYRVERTIERRAAAHREATQKSTLRFELDSSLQYPGPLYDDRRQEIAQAHAFAEAAAPLVATPARYGPQLNALLNKMAYHLEHQAPTPYREAVLQVKRRVEAALRGESPPAADDKIETPAVAVVGHTAPDFVVSDLTSGNAATVRLRRWLGRPVLLLFYNPSSPTAAELLRFGQRVGSTFHEAIIVAGMSVNEDAATIKKQVADLGLSFPVLNGSGLRVSYAVETTPKLVLIDASGTVRGAYLGWGRETPGEVMTEVRQWLKRP